MIAVAQAVLAEPVLLDDMLEETMAFGFGHEALDDLAQGLVMARLECWPALDIPSRLGVEARKQVDIVMAHDAMDLGVAPSVLLRALHRHRELTIEAGLRLEGALQAQDLDWLRSLKQERAEVRSLLIKAVIPITRAVSPCS